MIAEAAVPVMVLAVHVGRDHAADGNKLRARNDRWKKASWNDEVQEIGQEHPGLYADAARGLIKGADAVEATGQEGDPLPDGRIAVSAPVPAGHEPRLLGYQRQEGFRRCGSEHL
jgi:hypothetical protein